MSSLEMNKYGIFGAIFCLFMANLYLYFTRMPNEEKQIKLDREGQSENERKEKKRFNSSDLIVALPKMHTQH